MKWTANQLLDIMSNTNDNQETSVDPITKTESGEALAPIVSWGSGSAPSFPSVDINDDQVR